MAKPLVETKAKVGVFSIALQAYLPQFPQLVPKEAGSRLCQDRYPHLVGRPLRLWCHWRDGG